jgi:hypothetical protein
MPDQNAAGSAWSAALEMRPTTGASSLSKGRQEKFRPFLTIGMVLCPLCPSNGALAEEATAIAPPTGAAATDPTAPDCPDFDDDECAEADNVDLEKSFFDRLGFECQFDWLVAERGAARVLQKLDQEESFGQSGFREEDRTLRMGRLSRLVAAPDMSAILRRRSSTRSAMRRKID